MIYADTSALLKRYITEPASDRFDEFMLANDPLDISRLTVTEMRCALARRRRAGQITETIEAGAIRELRTDILNGSLRLSPVDDSHIVEAYAIIESVPSLPLRALDAIHLAIARLIGTENFATADKTQADAAEALGFTVHRFF
jgi:predicted nucleic acid-binding protein